MIEGLTLIDNTLYIDVFKLYKTCLYKENWSNNYTRWLNDNVLKIFKIGHELIPKDDNDTFIHNKRKYHRYWLKIDSAIILCRMIDNEKSRGIEKGLNKLKTNPLPGELFSLIGGSSQS